MSDRSLQDDNFDYDRAAGSFAGSLLWVAVLFACYGFFVGVAM